MIRVKHGIQCIPCSSRILLDATRNSYYGKMPFSKIYSFSNYLISVNTVISLVIKASSFSEIMVRHLRTDVV